MMLRTKDPPALSFLPTPTLCCGRSNFKMSQLQKAAISEEYQIPSSCGLESYSLTFSNGQFQVDLSR